MFQPHGLVSACWDVAEDTAHMECPQGHRKAALICKANCWDANIYFLSASASALRCPHSWAECVQTLSPFQFIICCHDPNPSFLMGAASTLILISLLLSWVLQDWDICEQS